MLYRTFRISNQIFRPNQQIFYSKRKRSFSIDEDIHIGDIISYTCEKWSSNGIPQKPLIYRIRRDKTWENILFGHSKAKSIQGIHSEEAIAPKWRF